MTEGALKYIDTLLSAAGINYEFGEWASDIVYPYFVGEYSEQPTDTEDGLSETDFTLNGFMRGSALALEDAKATIESAFADATCILQNGSGIDVSYAGALIVPTGDAELKRIQVSLIIKEWKVI